MHVFALGFPGFDDTNNLHQRLAELAELAEAVSSDVPLDPAWQFQKARRIIREALLADGVGGDIDEAVRQLMEP